ncbi:MAG: DegQ family serine endoprotease [Synergistales bacterium]|nr:DegQ family serine endoprotease [Synergistales bacterium]
MQNKLFARCGMVLAVALLMVAAVTTAGNAADPFTGNPVVKIAEKASPAVVNIDTKTMVRRSPFPFGDDPFFRRFFGEQYKEFSKMVPMRGKGSGSIVTQDGYILTNNHVVADADTISVTLASGKEYKAELVGKDPTFDLAVIKVDAQGLPTIEMGDSKNVQVGEWVAAIGNPFGLEHTVTVGVISAKNRTINAGNLNFQGFLQTDAAINPGNSGGPLLDMEGNMVGINTAIVPNAQGIGFAIPVDMARQVMDDLMKYGKVKRGWLGVYIQPITDEIADAYGLEGTEGALVSDVVDGSPAAKAGIHRGDVITKVEDETISKPDDLVFAIRKHMAGDRVSLTIVRKGSTEKKDVQLEAIPGQKEETKAKMDLEKKLGIAVKPLTSALSDKYEIRNVEEGMVVISVESRSPARQIGLKEGDVILEVNGRSVENGDDWQRALSRVDDSVVLLVSREGRTFFVSLKL